ncbi:sarcosine dehydrogenase, mitochondrial isoform X2 [Apteryx mantelli]|uniref:Sarcosine dehydrogenase, mitochondrial isoform X2 n=1 Tax=Apteryx mantelli TaxID=2696672 RepID=A0ABM4FJS8_9AVES
MASLTRALRRAAPWRAPRPLGGAGPTAEKSVPYRQTLKDESAAGSGPGRPLPPTAEVVVVGGGSLGCQTAYHLAKMGARGVALLERDRLTAGTTWHTAGLLWQLRPSDVEVELLAHTRHVVSRELPEETGLHAGWIQNGGLFIASSKQRLDEYKRLMSLGKVYGVESYVLSPSETKDLYPLMNVDDLYGTLYVPKDGTMDPAGTCSTLARAATARGAAIIENCPVTGIQVKVDDLGVKRVSAVETPYGTIQTPCVVNCAGVWARALGRMAGVHVPLVAMHHAYVVTERIEGIQNMPNVRDHDASVYLRLQGDALSVGGYESNPIFWEEVSEKFAFGLFDLDWDVFMQHIEGAVNRVPVLEKTGIKSTVCGPESFTADHKPLMGEAPEVRGFFLGCGFNSAGMMLGGGCGRELAHWIIHGRPEKDMYGYDIRRFPHSLTDNNRWLRERSHESYAKNYSVVFPYDEPLAGRNMRKDPLHEELLQQGCVFQERHGWERPGWFNPKGAAPVLDYDYYGAYKRQRHSNYTYNRLLGDEYTFDFPPHHHVIKNECLTCRNALALFDMSYFGKFYLVGPEATKAANWLFTADVSKAPDLLSSTRPGSRSFPSAIIACRSVCRLDRVHLHAEQARGCGERPDRQPDQPREPGLPAGPRLRRGRLLPGCRWGRGAAQLVTHQHGAAGHEAAVRAPRLLGGAGHAEPAGPAEPRRAPGRARHRSQQRGLPLLHPQAGEGSGMHGPCHEVVIRRRDGLGAARAQGGLRESLSGGDEGGCPARHYQRRLQSHRQPQHRERIQTLARGPSLRRYPPRSRLGLHLQAQVWHTLPGTGGCGGPESCRDPPPPCLLYH